MALEGTQGRRLALVTGASSGIGWAYALRLAREGHDLLLAARRKDRLDEVAAEARARHGVEVETVAVDLSTAEGVDALLAAAAERPVEALVHCAGFGTRGLFVEIDEARTLTMLNLHVTAPVRLVRACLPGMLERGRGEVVLVSSLASFFTTSRYVTYSATKAYLNTFALGLADEVVAKGVKVQALCPGLTKTPFLETEEYAGFDYSEVPAAMWMTAEGVVEESRRALGTRSVVFVPGLPNRLFVNAMNGPAGPVLRRAIELASRLGASRNGGDASKALF